MLAAPAAAWRGFAPAKPRPGRRAARRRPTRRTAVARVAVLMAFEMSALQRGERIERGQRERPAQAGDEDPARRGHWRRRCQSRAAAPASVQEDGAVGQFVRGHRGAPRRHPRERRTTCRAGTAAEVAERGVAHRQAARPSPSYRARAAIAYQPAQRAGTPRRYRRGTMFHDCLSIPSLRIAGDLLRDADPELAGLGTRRPRRSGPARRGRNGPGGPAHQRPVRRRRRTQAGRPGPRGSADFSSSRHPRLPSGVSSLRWSMAERT